MDEKLKLVLVISFIILYTLSGSVLVVILHSFKKRLVYIEHELKNIYNNSQSMIDNLEYVIKLGNYILTLEKEVYKTGKNTLIEWLSLPLIKIVNGKWGVKWWARILVKKILSVNEN